MGSCCKLKLEEFLQTLSAPPASMWKSYVGRLKFQQRLRQWRRNVYIEECYISAAPPAAMYKYYVEESQISVVVSALMCNSYPQRKKFSAAPLAERKKLCHQV